MNIKVNGLKYERIKPCEGGKLFQTFYKKFKKIIILQWFAYENKYTRAKYLWWIAQVIIKFNFEIEF